MNKQADVVFSWQNETYQGKIEREYTNSYLIEVLEPFNEEILEKYANRMIISKKACRNTISEY